MMFRKYHHLLSKSPVGAVPCLIPESQVLMSWMPPPPRKVLDVGSGQGSYTRLLRHTGHDVTAFDMDNSQFPEAHVGDMHELPYKNRKFDVVFCSGTFEHAFAPYIVLSEFCRVLKNHGIILMNMPSADNVKMMELPEHFNSLSRLQLESLYCTKLGMKIIRYAEEERDPVVGSHQCIMLVVTK